MSSALAVLVLCAAPVSSPSTPSAIALLPLGEVPGDVVDGLVPVLRERFGRQVRVAPALPLPEAAYHRGRRQYSSSFLLDVLAGARRPDWERVLGVVDVDLYVPDLSFVFGEGDPRRRVAVFSLRRLHAQTSGLLDPRLRERAATEAVHELGHAYGLRHCSNRRCVMWFSNTLAESDGKGSRFCPAHAAKLPAR